ncbi:MULTISPECIES: MFS transporter [Streptomyces]|uniref:Putative proline/betaine transporter n=1 Tax=Streptomyces odorifer TaxID=53450 RepID=A0A7Y6CAH4_9ACTN|nr:MULTISPECIES: MFS transporter [Streptomyces]NUV36760.1 MHS family MFS transporter [Streptomyces sp. KAI-27]NUV48015.1 MHS family MFS transporter [Streptomyces sp. CAI-78]MBL0779195.1 MHS family MFS transporter [Streptomyces albidoflavus]MBL0800205.1 MHS family MFS transporter [Streptomyces albidoflavus]MBV1958855.1 MHS family MFS transporter [Streptomyces sp. BV333]
MDSPASAQPVPPAAPVAPNRRRVAGAAALASAVEWYDYFIFGIAAALVLGDLYFPADNPTAGVLAAFATFAVGFLARPIGGIVAGQLGDKKGRKPMLVLALTVMGLATTGIGLLPTYETIGVAAPILLVLLRIAQGVAVGAQWGGAMLLATEYAPEGKRGIYGSVVQLGVPIGVVTANSVFLAAGALTSDSAFTSWGWRVPFLVGLLVLILAWYIHTRVEETPEFRQAEQALAEKEKREQNSPLRTILRGHLGTVLLAGGSFAVNTATFYILITGILDYTTRELGMERGPVLAVSLCVSLTQLVLIPASAALSDRVGRLRVYAAGAAGIALWAVPLFLLVDTGSLLWLAVGTFVASCFLSIMYGPQAALFAELFTPEMRYTGASLGYQISAVAGGGLAPFLMVLLLEATGTSMAVSGYIIALSLIALLSIWSLARKARARGE